MKTVTLMKGPKGQRVWKHTTDMRAYLRADALAELHNTEVTSGDEGYVVDATRFYEAAARRKRLYYREEV